MKDTMKLGAILFLITSVCAGLLGLVNSITAPIIEEKKEIAKQKAMQILIPEASDFTVVDGVEDQGIEELYIAKVNDTYLGAIAKVAPEGYGGAIELLVGVDENLAVTGIHVLSHSETPGLGANILEESFQNQFISKKAPIEVVKGSADDNEISAITGAAITSRAVTEGVNVAVTYISSHQDTLNGGAK